MKIEISRGFKIALAIIVFIVFLVSLPFFFYLKILPYVVSNEKAINLVESSAEKILKADVEIEKPEIQTSVSTFIGFKIDKLSIKKENDQILLIKKLDTQFSLKKIFEKTLIVDTIGLDYIYVDINKLTESLVGEQKAQQQKSDFNVDLFEALLYVKKAILVYQINPETILTVDGERLAIARTQNPKLVHFDIKIKVKQKDNEINLKLNDGNKVYTNKKTLFIKDCILNVNKSVVLINAEANRKKAEISFSSKNFNISDVIKLINSNLIVPNGKEMLSMTKDIKGTFDFNIRLTPKTVNGTINLDSLTLKILPLANLPIKLQKGSVYIDNNQVTLKDFAGYYGANQKLNSLDFSGTVKDYTKSVDTEIKINTVAQNEFVEKYMSKLVGFPCTLKGKAKTLIVVKSIYNKIDVMIGSKLAKGDDILIDGASFSPVNYDRAAKIDLHLEGNILTIKNINYYIASEINKNSKLKPLVRIYGNIDLAQNNKINDIGFEIPKPLPSEFLNLFVRQKLFKKGTIQGYFQYINTGKVPKLKGNFNIEKVRIPSQRLSFKKASATTTDNIIKLSAEGKYKKTNYNFSGEILNELVFPIIVKDINLTIDNLDVERIMKSFNSQNQTPVQSSNQNKQIKEQKSDDDTVDIAGMIIIEKCLFHLIKGHYKDVNFGNIKANLTFDKNNILKIDSNRFDIAEGHSSLKVYCDLMKHKYNLWLGVKDVNSDIMATSILGLKKEISGKASGLIEINTDESLKLNGRIRFIVKNGTIAKVGLIEYALKFAALFRNPMAMISPSTIVDLVNIPEGTFDSITGDLRMKNNVVERIMIKSKAAQLSSFIIGRFDLETRDATLRIYTKFSSKNKGFAGFLRNFSLNRLANRMPFSTKNESQYYQTELSQLPPLEADEKDCQVFLTTVDGDVEHFNFLSSLKKIK